MLKPSRFVRLLWAGLWLSGLLSAPAQDMIFPGGNWVEATPESQGLNAAKLQAAVKFLEENAGSDGVRELVIVRNGRLIWKGDSVDKRHGVWSCTKSFTSAALGLLIADGRCGLDTRAADFVPEMKGAYPDVTLRHFTTMTSGYRAVGDETTGSYNNHKCFVIPEWNMVIVRLGLDQNDRKISDEVLGAFLARVGEAMDEKRSHAGTRTQVSIKDGRWHLNGQVTYPGTRAEGLLMNVRMVNSTFEDRNKPEFDAEKNTDKFMARIPEYAAQGVRAFTLCLQGGMPGYEGAINSAFNPDGSLRESYLRRVQRVIAACDRHGLAVILGCYYQRQDQILRDEDAVRAGVMNVVRWINSAGLRNVVLEIANEYDHPGFGHRILRTPEGQLQLIALAKRARPGLPVSTSGLGDGRMNAPIAAAADFILIHFNGTKVEEIPARIRALKKFNKPIVCNEDDKNRAAAAQAAELSVANGASWGLMLNTLNQYVPFEFNGAADDPIVYAKLKELTTDRRPP